MYNFIRTWDVYHYFLAASGILEGQAVRTEYPLGALVPMIIPRLFTSDYGAYALLFHLQTVLVFLLGLFMVWRSRARSGFWPYAAVFLLMFPMAIERLDIYVAVLALASLWFLMLRRDLLAALSLLAATSVKFFPIVLFPLLALRSRRPFFFGVAAALSVLVILLNGYGLSFHASRGVQPESLYGTYLYLAGARQTEYAYNAIQLADSSMPLWLTGAVMGAFVFLSARARGMWTKAYYLVLGFIVAFKVFSPTYLLWLAPFLPFVGKRKAAAVIIASALTMWYLGFYEQAVVNLQFPYVLVLLARNAAVLLAAVL